MGTPAVIVLVHVLVAGSGGGTGAVTCTALERAPLTSQEAVVTRLGGDHWRWRASTGDLLQCSAAGFEPRDLVAPPASEAVTLTLLASRQVTLTRPGAIEAELEWREDGPKGTVLLARRHLAARDALHLPVASDRVRLLRIFRPGMAPNTIAIGKDIATLPLPEAVRGGELYVACRRDTWNPEQIIIDASTGRARVANVLAGRATHAGLPPGAATVRSRYRGGIEADRQSVRITEGQTAELVPYPNRKNGALSVSAASARLCEDATGGELRIRSESSSSALQRLPLPARCEGVFAGLDPADYAVELRVGGREIARGRAAVEAGAVNNVLLESYGVHVEGSVSAGSERPLSGATLTFRSAATGNPSQPVLAVTDAGGTFAIDLPHPGTYGVALKASDYFEFEIASRSFVAGSQRLDLDVPPSSIVVKIRRDDGGEVPEFIQVGVDGPIRMNSPASGAGVTLTGLPLGDYTLGAASTSPRMSSAQVHISLTDASPAATVELILASAAGVLRLRGPSGQPVTGAHLVGAGKEIGPGTYDLAGVPEDAIIQIQADGYLPSCWRRTGASGEKTLIPLGSQLLRIHVAEADSPYGLVIRVPGSECGIPLSLFSPRLEPEEQRTVVEIPGLAPGLYVVAFGSVVREVTVPGADMTFTKPQSVPGP
jgi:hypothetical protein